MLMGQATCSNLSVTAISHQGIGGEGRKVKGRGDYPVCTPLVGWLGRIMEGEIKSPHSPLHFRSSFHFKPDRIERLMWNTGAGGSQHILTRKLVPGQVIYFVI